MTGVTRILDAIERGDPNASNELLPLVYEELRKLAAQKMAHEAQGQTLQPTALVHEAWLKLAGSNQNWDSRGHFFAAAAEAMRRILVSFDHAQNRALEEVHVVQFALQGGKLDFVLGGKRDQIRVIPLFEPAQGAHRNVVVRQVIR